MGRAFEGNIPDEVIARLKPGDLILVQTFGWWVSWLILYLTNSSVTHVAHYLGNGRIAHMAEHGAIHEPIEALFTPNARLMPFVVFLSDAERRKTLQLHQVIKNMVYYDKKVLVRKALAIILGRDWYLFQWALFVDIALILIFLDVLILSLFRFPFFSLLIPLYLMILLINRTRWLRRPVAVVTPEYLPIELFKTGRGVPLLDAKQRD